MSEKLEFRNTIAKIKLANSFLNNEWQSKGIVTIEDINKVVTPIMLENGAVIMIKRSENYNFHGEIVPPEDNETIYFVTYQEREVA